MARIRTIKPEFWNSPGVGELDPWARLLFIAMWNWADDHGCGIATPGELRGFAFPNDDHTLADIGRMLGGIRRALGVKFYKVGGRPCYSIPSWESHQKIDKRSTRRCPGPNEGEPWDPDPDTPPDLRKRQDSANSAESPPRTRRSSGAGTEEQRNRGTEERETASAVSGTSLALRPAPAAPPSPTSQTLIAEWIDHCADKPPNRVVGQIASEIKKMLDEGIPYERVRAGLAEWNGRGLHPSTLASVVHELANRKQRTPSKQAETNDIFDAAMQRAIAKEGITHADDRTGSRGALPIHQGMLPAAGD